MEKGLLRFEVYKVIGEDALIIHETFENTSELQFHLSKGTAEKYKKDILLYHGSETIVPKDLNFSMLCDFCI